MKLTTILVLALVSFGVNAAGKTAYINSKILLEESPQAIAVKNQLREQFGDREANLRNLLQQIQEMEKNYQNDAAIMSAEQKQKAEENILQNKRRFQFEQQSLKVDHIVTATGSAGTHGGLAVGIRGGGSDLPILGIGVNAPQHAQEERVYKLACETADLVGEPLSTVHSRYTSGLAAMRRRLESSCKTRIP